jgi:Fe-S-cluster containining protein
MEKSLPIVSNCQGCGVCCLHIGYPPYVLPHDGHPGEYWWQVLPAALRTELELVMVNYQLPSYDGTVESLDGPCCWYDCQTGRCLNHQHRPNVCREFQPGSRGCLEWRAHYKIDER